MTVPQAKSEAHKGAQLLTQAALGKGQGVGGPTLPFQVSHDLYFFSSNTDRALLFKSRTEKGAFKHKLVEGQCPEQVPPVLKQGDVTC